MNLGELIVELSADSSELEKTLERAKKKAYEAAVAVEKSFENINLNVGVDDDSLVDLNKHLNLKVQHLKEVNKYFTNNPIVVNVDDKELTDLNKHLNLKVQHLKEVNKYFDSNPIKVNTDTKSLDELEERLGGLSNRTITITVESDLSKQLEKSLADAVKNAVKEEMSGQTSTVQQEASKESSQAGKTQNVNVVASPSRAILDGIFEGLGKGFTNGINQSIEDAVGVDIPTMTRISSNMFLRYFGVGKKAQSDPSKHRKRVKAIVTDGVAEFVEAHNIRATQQQAKSNSIAANGIRRNRKKAHHLSATGNDIDVDFEATGQVAAQGFLRYFGVGKKAQSDPKEEKARIEAILKAMVDDYIQSQTPAESSTVNQFLSQMNVQFFTEIEQSLVNTAQRAKSATIGAVRKGSQNILANSSAKIQNAVNGVFNSLEGSGDDSGSFGGKIGSQIVNFAKQSAKSTTKTILPNTYGVVSEFLKTGTINAPKPKLIPVTPESELKQAASNLESATKGLNEYIANVSTVSTDSGLSQAAISLENAAQSLNNAVNTLNNSISAINSMTAPVTTQATQAPIEQPLNIPVNIPKKPQPELELVPIKTTASQVPQQLKQHFEAIKTNTLKNVDLSKQYVEATAKENGEELVPFQLGTPKKSDEIKAQKEISLNGISNAFKIINQYFNTEYKQLKSEFDQVKLTGTSAEIKATKQKIKEFVSYSEKAVADIDAIAKQAQDAGFDKTINSDLSKAHAKGKSQVKARQTNAKGLIDKLNTEEKSIFNKQLTYYAPLAQQLGIDIDAGLAKGIQHGSDGVSDVARKMLDNLIKTVEAKMKIQSPSWVMFEIGMMIASGLFFGMQKGNSKVSEGARKMVTTVKSAFDPLNDLSSLSLAGTYMIPNLSDISNKAMIAMSATSTGLNMLDKVGEHHAANPDQTLFQATYGTAKNFVKDAVTDKSFVKPREAVDHLVNIAKFGTELVTPLGLKAFTNPIGSANDGVAAAFRTMAIAKSLKQAHQDTKQQTQQDPSLTYANVFKNVLPQHLKQNNIGRAEALKMFGGGLKVVPDMHGSNDANLYNAGALAMGTAASLGNATIGKFAPVANFVQTGKDVVKGLEQGILKNTGIATNAITGLGDSIQSQIKQNMGISSPSKVMIALGLMIASGLAIGIKKGVIDVSSATDGLTDMVINKMKSLQSLPSQNIEAFQEATLNASSPNSELTQKVYDESKGISKPTAFGSMIGTIMMGLANSGLTPKNIETPLRHLGAFYQGTAQVHKLNSALAREAEIATIFNMMQAAEKEGYLPDGGFVNMVKHENLPTLAHTLGGFNYTQTKDGGLQINDVYDWHNSEETDKNTPFSLPNNFGKKIYSMLDKNQWLVNLLGLESTDFGGSKAYSKYDTNTGRELFSFLNKEKHDFQLGHSVHSSVIGGSPYIQTHNLNKDEFDNLIDLATKPYLKSKSIKGNPNLKSFLEHPEISKYIKATQSSDEGGIKSFVSAVKKDFGEGSKFKKVFDNIFDPVSSQLNKQYEEYYQQLDQQEKSGDYKNRLVAEDIYDKLENPNNDMTKESVLSLISAHRMAGVRGDSDMQSRLHNILLNQFKANNPSIEGIGDKINKVKDLFGSEGIGDKINKVKDLFGSGFNFKEIGGNLISSFAQGFMSANGGVLGIVTKFAKGILSAVKKVFRIASPSGEGIDTGENYASSHAIGINNQAQTAVNAARNMAENVRNAIADPWDTPLPMNPVFQQDLDLENQAQAHIKATKEHFQKLKIQDLLSDIGINFGADFGHEDIASNVLSSSELFRHLNRKSANLTPLQRTDYNRLVDDFQNQKAIAAHHFAIARADGNPVDPAVLRGLDAGFNSILLRIVEFSKTLGIKGQSIDKLLASNQSVVNTAAYQPPKFVAPKTPIPERQPGQTDQEYSQAVKRALAEDNNNYRKAKNAYNRMILGISEAPTPQRTQLPALPPVPVYVREIIEPVTNVQPVQRTQATIPPIPDPWNDSVEQLVNTVRQTARIQFLLPPARERLSINSFVQTQSNLQRLAKEIIAQQPMTQLSRPQPPTIQRTSPIILPRNFVPNPNAQILFSRNFAPNPNAQIISSQKFTPKPDAQILFSRNFAPNPNAQIISSQKFTPKPDAQILSSKNFVLNPNAQIISSQKFTPKPDAQLILPVVQGLSPAIRSTHSLAQNSISALIAANKQIQATITGNKVTVSSRFAPIPDPWTTPPLSIPPLPTQTVKQLSKQMTGQYGPIPDSWLTSSRSTQAFKQAGKVPTGQIPITLSSTVPSFIPQPAGTATPKYVFPPQTLGTTVPAYTFPVNPTPNTSSAPSISNNPNLNPVRPLPPTLLKQYLNLGTDLVTNIFNAVSTSIRQSTLSGYASLGQVMRNAVNAALFSLADTLKQPLHQALLSQTRSILPWFLKFIPRSFQLLPKLSFAIPFVGGMVLRFGNSIVKNLLENNILKEGGFLTNLLSSITRVDLSALSGTKTAGVTGFLKNIVSPVPLLVGSQFNPLLALGISSTSPFYDAFSGILGLDKSVKPNPKKQAPTIEQVLQNQTKINREKALLRDVKEVSTSTNISTGVRQNLTTYPDAQRTKTEELLKQAVESGKAIPKLDELTRKALRERGVSSFVRNRMDSTELLTQRENILKNPLNATSKERDFLLYTADMKKANVATLKEQEKRIISILKERGKSDQDIENIRNSGADGLFDVGDDLIKNLPTITKQPTATQTVQPRTSSASIASKELVENLGNTLLNSVLNNLDIPVIPKSVIQRMIGRKMGERSATIADAINAFGIEKSKAEQVLTRNLESGNTKRLDGLTKQILRERGVTESVRNAMTPEQLAASREKITKSPIDLTARERKLLKFMGDFESHAATMGNDVATRKRDAMAMSVLQERGMSRAERKQIQQSQGGQGLSSFADNLRDNPRTGGFMGRLTEAYASNDQDAMKELVKQGLRKTGMSAKQINNIDPKLLDTATAGLMTTLSGLQAKFREKGFDMGKALAKGLKDSMVNLANAKDDLEYNAKKVMGQANFGDSVGLIFRRMFRGTVATQGQFAEMYNQMGSGVKNLIFKDPKEGDEIFPNILQFVGSITTTLAPITTMMAALSPLMLPLAPIITGIGMAVNMVAPHVAKLIDGIQRVEVLQRRFKFLGGSKEGGIAEFNYAKDIAGKLNVPSEVAANSYSQLAIAAKDSKMEGQGVKELFEGITSSLSALGINGQDASLVFMAYTQILAKGKLSMEELRQQLGEKFPPAMATFAKAMGVTIPEMNELVASGGILSQDILPKVAKVLKEDYGSAAADQAGGLAVALNKLGNVGFEITSIFTDKLSGTLAFFVNTLANGLSLLTSGLKEMIPLVQSFMIGFAATISIGLTIILSKFGPLRVAIGSLQNFLLATFSAITTNMMPMVIGVVSDVADGWLGAERNLMDNMFQGINNMIVTVFSTIDTAMRSMSNYQVSFSTVFGGLIQGAEQAGSIIDWLKGVFTGFFKILPSGIVEILAIVFMLEQGTGLAVMALWPAITKLWGGITGIFGATAKAFYGVMGTIKSVIELMMTSSAVASHATNNVAASGVRSTAIVQGALGFLSKALLHFGVAYAVLMFSKGDFSDPLRESINKSTADINKHLTQVRLNIGQTTEAFNKATKSVEKLGNTITDALPAKGVQLDIRSLWGGGDYKWDDAVRDTNAKYRPGGTGASAMDVIGTGALYAGGAGYAAAAGSKAIKAITDLAVKTAPIIQQNKALVAQGIQATSITRVTLLGRLATAIAPVVAIMGPWGLAIAGLIAAIGLATVALDAFAPKITEAQLKNTVDQGGLPEEIKQIINAKKAGERLDSASLQVIKLYKDQQLSNQRLKEFMASIGLDGKTPYSFVARPVVPMTKEQKEQFESEIPVQNITKSIEDKKASLQGLEKNAGTTETEKSKARSKEGYKTVQEELTQLEKDKVLMQLSFMANYDNKSRMDAIDKQIKNKEEEISKTKSIMYRFDSFQEDKKLQQQRKELEKLQKEKAALQTNINASAKRRVNYDAIKKIDVDIEKTAAEFVEASNQLAVNPNEKLRNKAGLAKERIAQLQKRRQKLVDEFGDPTPAIKQMLEVTKREIEKTLSDSSILPQQRTVTVQQLRKTQETLEKSLAEAEKFSIAPIADTMYTQAVAALKDNEVKSNVDISKNKIVSNQAQARLYGTTLTSQQIAPGLSDRQIADLTFQQKVLERSLKIKEDSLLKLQIAAAGSPTNLSQIQEEITKLQQEIAKDREQVSQNTLEIIKAQREARQALIDQTKQVAEYYRTSLRESQAAAIEFDKATNNIKSQQFATKLKQALVGAGNNIFTNFIDSVIGLFQQLTEIENLRLDRQKQKLDYENNIQDILIKVTEMQRSLPGKIVPFDVSKIRDFDKELGTVNKSVSSINKEVNNVANGIGVSAVNSTINLNKALQDLLKTLQDINKNPLNPTTQPFNNSSSSNTPVGISQKTKIPVTPEDEQIWRKFVAPESGIKSGTSSLPTSTPVANAPKEMLVAGLMSDMGYGYYSQVTKSKPKLPDNAFLSPIVGKSLSNIINTKYRPEDSFGKTGGIRFNQNIGVSKNTNIQSSVTGMATLIGNTLEIIKQTKGGTIKLIYEGLNIPSVKKNLKLNDGGSVNINAGQLIGTLAGNNFKFRTEVNSSNMDPLKVVRDIEYKRLNAFQKAARFFDQPNKAVTNLGLLPEPKSVTTTSTPSTPPVNRFINKVKGFVRRNTPEPVKEAYRNARNFVNNVPRIDYPDTSNSGLRGGVTGIIEFLIPQKPKTPGKKPTATNQGTGKKPTATNQSKSGSGTNQGTGKKPTPTNQGNVPNLSGMFPQPSTGGLTPVSNTGNQIPPDLSSAFPQSSRIKLTNASTGTPSTGAGQTPTNNNTGKLPSPQPQVPNIAGKPGTDPLVEQKKGGYVDPNTSQRFTTKAAEEAAKAAAQRDAAARLLRQEEISAKLVEFQRNLSNLSRDTNKGIRDESQQAAQDINNASEYIQGLLNPNASDKEKFATDFQKLKNEYQARINEQQNIIESTKVPLAELARVDELIAAAQREGIDASGLKAVRDEVYRVVKAREQTAIALRKMYIDNKNKVFDTYVDRFKDRELNRKLERSAALLGVDISQLKLQLERLKAIQADDPLNPELLEIPDLEANIADLELTQSTQQKIVALLNEWQQSGGKNMSQEVFKKRAEDIMNTVTKQTGIIERKRRTDNTVAYVNRELGLIDKGAAEREPITKGLQLDNSLFAARNKNGLVNIINFENEALIKQKDLMDSYRKTSLETQRDFKLSSDERITKRLRNAMNLQKELDVLKVETEYQKAAGEIKNRQVTVDVEVRLSDSAKAIFESKSTIKKNLGLELAGERIDRQNAITAQENEYKRKQNETNQFILDNNLTDSQANELRKNDKTLNTAKLREIEMQFSEFAQVIKSFVSGFKSSFKEFLLSTEDTGTALLNLAKGIGRSVMDTLAEIAAKRVTDLLFGWIGGAGLNPSQELSVAAQNLQIAAQQLTQAAYALQTATGASAAGASALGMGSFGGFAGFGGIDSFSPTGMEFLDPSTFAASDFGTATLTGFAKGGMIDKDTLGKIQNFANGGIVGTMNKERAMTGRTPHLVVASEGERILNHKETAIWNKLQTGISGFADGGIVGGGSGDIASKIGGSTTTVNVPVSVSVNEGSDVDGARLSQTVQALVSDGIRREMRPGGSIRRGNPYGR